MKDYQYAGLQGGLFLIVAQLAHGWFAITNSAVALVFFLACAMSPRK